jgi:hypothetical protein
VCSDFRILLYKKRELPNKKFGSSGVKGGIQKNAAAV